MSWGSIFQVFQPPTSVGNYMAVISLSQMVIADPAVFYWIRYGTRILQYSYVTVRMLWDT